MMRLEPTDITCSAEIAGHECGCQTGKHYLDTDRLRAVLQDILDMHVCQGENCINPLCEIKKRFGVLFK